MNILRKLSAWRNGYDEMEDDGHIWAVCTEPSPFRVSESRLEGPFTKGQARKFAVLFCRREPFGAAHVDQLPLGTTWPPRTNWGERRERA